MKTLLLGLDGLDWQILDPLLARGELPNFRRLLAAGVRGNLHTLEPTLSPMLWNSIATGKRAAAHGIHGFTEVDAASGAVRPVSSVSRQCKAVWNILMQHGARVHVLNWFASHPAEPLSGSAVSDFYPEGAPPRDQAWPLRAGTVFPERLRAPLADLRVGPDEVPPEILGLFVPRAAEVDQREDKALWVLARELAKAWSVHNAATWLLHGEPWDFLAVYWRTPDLLFHHFMPYHPPAVAGCDEKKARLYGDVVNGTCRLYDLMLGAYLHLAGEDANIALVSDHGFQSGARRPAIQDDPFKNPEAWHRPQGVLLLRGPALKRGVEIHGARLPDVTPTLLALHGLPVAGDMDGRVLAEAFREPPPLEAIPSWEKVPGADGRHPPGTRIPEADAAVLLRQFEDLGYIEPLSADQDQAAAQTRAANRWNLARDLFHAGRPLEALPLLEELHHEQPANPAFTHALAGVQFRLGLADEAAQSLAAVVEKLKPGPGLTLLRGQIACERRQFAEGLRLLRELESTDADNLELQWQLGRAYLGLHRRDDARRAFERVLAADADHAGALQSLAFCYLRERFWELAAATALRAVGLDHSLPRAHFFLALALERLHCRDDALLACETALAYAPGFVGARRALVRLLARTPGREAEAARQRELLERLTARAPHRADRLAELRQEIAARARERALRAPPPVAPVTATTAPSPAAALPSAQDEILVVSGLPRSGTSLLMQMLLAGGCPVLTDGRRAADPDNPAGYLEWEAVKRLPKEPRVLDAVGHRAVKIVSPLLEHLPRDRHYRLLFMERAPAEVAASQATMLRRRHPAKPHGDPAHLTGLLARHHGETLRFLRGSAHIALLVIPYGELVKDPARWSANIAQFVGPGRLPSAAAMPAVVRPELHRQRQA